jgi:hypothetical protein
VLAEIARRFASHELSVARLIQVPVDGGAALHVVLHEAAQRDIDGALAEIESLEEVRAPASALPVVSDRGVVELGWA